MCKKAYYCLFFCTINKRKEGFFSRKLSEFKHFSRYTNTMNLLSCEIVKRRWNDIKGNSLKWVIRGFSSVIRKELNAIHHIQFQFSYCWARIYTVENIFFSRKSWICFVVFPNSQKFIYIDLRNKLISCLQT